MPTETEARLASYDPLQKTRGVQSTGPEEPPGPPDPDPAEVRALIESGVDAVAALLVERYGYPKAEANTLASRQRERFRVSARGAGPQLEVATMDGARHQIRQTGITRLAFEIARQAEQDEQERRERERYAPPLTTEERADRKRGAGPYPTGGI